ncbi:MAG TPA: hypothetical protein VM098_10265 [Phycisphaerae bacterium]|nr:hypothetical protein [Phycisphaerae bacterium]
MRSDKLLILVVFLLAVAGIVAYQLFGNGSTSKPADRPPQIPSKPREFLGITLQLHSGSEDHPYEQYVREIAETGADTISITVCGYQENVSSTSIFIDVRKTPSDKRLKELLRYCRQADPKTGKPPLKVVLMVIVLLEHRRGEEWRGTIEPTNWNDWWSAYTNYVTHYAKIAQETGVEVMLIGSELVSTELQADRWKRLIADVRGAYKGRLGYSANWDHYQPITWWKDLDIIGMTTYYNLSKGKKPNVELLKEAWRPIKEKILTWRNANYPNHPILFTEVGWPNQVTCAEYPWNYYEAADKPDPKAQADCFEAFFATWMDEPAVVGYLVWEWRNSPWQEVGEKDTSYVPCKKPAEQVIRKHYWAAREKKTTATPAEGPAESQPTSR